jgi:hypothetical protein
VNGIVLAVASLLFFARKLITAKRKAPL